MTLFHDWTSETSSFFRETLKNKPLVISTKRKELNQRKGQTYGRCWLLASSNAPHKSALEPRLEKLPLVSEGWHHRKSVGDHFTIQPIMGNKATNLNKSVNTGERKDLGGGRPPTFADYGLSPALVDALSK